MRRICSTMQYQCETGARDCHAAPSHKHSGAGLALCDLGAYNENDIEEQHQNPSRASIGDFRG